MEGYLTSKRTKSGRRNAGWTEKHLANKLVDVKQLKITTQPVHKRVASDSNKRILTPNKVMHDGRTFGSSAEQLTRHVEHRAEQDPIARSTSSYPTLKNIQLTSYHKWKGQGTH